MRDAASIIASSDVDIGDVEEVKRLLQKEAAEVADEDLLDVRIEAHNIRQMHKVMLRSLERFPTAS